MATMNTKQYLPEKDYRLPDIDVLTMIFDSPLSWTNEATILHAEAADPSNKLTKAECRVLTKRLSHTFRHEFGIGANGPDKDVVVCISSGQIILAPLFYGVVGAGGIYSAASSAFQPSELTRQLKQGRSTLLLASVDAKDVAIAAAKQCDIPLSRVLIFNSMGHKRELMPADGKKVNYLDNRKEMSWPKITDPEKLKTSRACLLYSSGTTGPPKGVIVSHLNIVAEGLLPQFLIREYFVRRRLKEPNYKFEYRTLAHLPAAHIAGLQGYLVNPAIAGGPVYWMPKFDFVKFLEYNKKFRITTFFTVPPIYLLIAKSPLVRDQFASMEHAISGAAPMGRELQQAVQQKMGCYVSQTWGLSETTGSVTLMKWDENDLTGSVSKVLPNQRLRIVDDDENDVEEGQEGELLAQGPVVTQGYFDNENATKESFTRDGLWYKTGDIGVRRANGLFYVVDRKKELIKYKGLQVAPAELEAYLIAHSKILDAAVIGVPAPDGSGNELPRAYVVADKNVINEDQIKEYVKKELASHKQLRGGVIYLDAIPKSPSGKILRRELREMAKKENRTTGAKL
ncbi:hypothetical protein LTR05_000954 [Lithohypha guttulata]|uniref:Luciferase n=1 Tax=Lithohypha guttulata TaxID=1690604 RepID=A0AAN7Y9Y4_9EURO|nr:hypothetical protein LTR05_000954 [Lithohypha guttulata]